MQLLRRHLKCLATVVSKLFPFAPHGCEPTKCLNYQINRTSRLRVPEAILNGRLPRPGLPKCDVMNVLLPGVRVRRRGQLVQSGAEKRKSGVEKRKSGAEKRKSGAEKRNCTLGPPYTASCLSQQRLKPQFKSKSNGMRDIRWPRGQYMYKMY